MIVEKLAGYPYVRGERLRRCGYDRYRTFIEPRHIYVQVDRRSGDEMKWSGFATEDHFGTCRLLVRTNFHETMHKAAAELEAALLVALNWA